MNELGFLAEPAILVEIKMRSLRDQPPVKEPRIKAADRIIAAVE